MVVVIRRCAFSRALVLGSASKKRAVERQAAEHSGLNFVDDDNDSNNNGNANGNSNNATTRDES